MTEELEILWNLRAVDEQRAALKSALDRFPVLRSDLDHRVAAEKARLEVVKGRINELQKNRRGREKDIETVTAEERKFQNQLPAIKKNEEYTALLHEIQVVKAKRSEIETEVLMMLDEEEKAAQEKPAIEQALAAAERESAARRAQIDREESVDKEQLSTVDAERSRLVDKLPAGTRSRYERIYASRGGHAIVAISKDACGGCYRGQPPQTIVEAKRGDRLLLCDGCGRLMIWPPETG
jgi:uncharacterized protein